MTIKLQALTEAFILHSCKAVNYKLLQTVS